MATAFDRSGPLARRNAGGRGRPRGGGRATFLAPGFERFKYAAQADLQSLEVSGDPGSARGIVTITLTPKAGGEAVTRALRYLIVFRRVAKDDWRILLDMDNRVP